MYTVYALKSINRNYIYVGMTSNLDSRINYHQQGYEKTTKPFRPFRLIYAEILGSQKEARNQEKKLKSGFGKEWLKYISVDQN